VNLVTAPSDSCDSNVAIAGNINLLYVLFLATPLTDLSSRLTASPEANVPQSVLGAGTSPTTLISTSTSSVMSSTSVQSKYTPVNVVVLSSSISISVPSTVTVTFASIQALSKVVPEGIPFCNPEKSNIMLSNFTESDLDGFNVNLAIVISLSCNATVFLDIVVLSEIVIDPFITYLNVFNPALANPADVPLLSSHLKYKSKLIFSFVASLSGEITAWISTLTDFPASTNTSSKSS
jgi:hypothetical protein